MILPLVAIGSYFAIGVHNTGTVEDYSKDESSFSSDLSDQAQITPDFDQDQTPNSSPQQSTSPSPQVKQTPSTPTPISQSDDAAMKKAQQDLANQQAAFIESQRQQKCALIADNYPVYINQENAYHQSNIDAINRDYQSRGMVFSGAYQAAINSENSRYQQKLDSLRSNYNSQVAQYGC